MTSVDSEIKVSVVTIAFRDLPGLQRTLNSTAIQHYPNIEHVVIDGGSGPEVVRYLENSGVDYWQSRPDAGRYDAMNQGIDHASGDLLWFMHAGDTFADADAVSIAVKTMSAEGDARSRWGYGAARLVGNDARSGRIWCHRPFDHRKFALGTRPIPHQAAFFGADLVKNVGYYSTTFGLAADHLFMLLAAQLAPPVLTERVLCDFDTSGAGSVRSQREHYHDVRRSWDEAAYYPAGGRLRSLALSRGAEWNARLRASIHHAVDVSRTVSQR
jgi:glycosyltransferase involved in cell wall biosynthesis